MIYAYHLIVCLFLIIFQTTIVTNDGSVCMYDLLVPYVVYLATRRQRREGLPVLVVIGLAMDGLSGGVFGVHVSAYLWLYVAVRSTIQFLHVGNIWMTPLLVASAVAFKSIVEAFVAVVLAAAAWSLESVFPVVLSQIVWGAVTGPLLMLLFVRGEWLVEQLRHAWAEKKESLGTL